MRCRIGKHGPSVLFRPAPQPCEHGGLAEAKLSRYEHQPSRGTGTVIQCLFEVAYERFPAGKDRRHLASSWREWILQRSIKNCAILILSHAEPPSSPARSCANSCRLACSCTISHHQLWEPRTGKLTLSSGARDSGSGHGSSRQPDSFQGQKPRSRRHRPLPGPLHQ